MDEKSNEINKLLSILKFVRDKKKKEVMKGELKKLIDKYKTLEERILMEGDIITLVPKKRDKDVYTNMGGGIMIGSSLKGDLMLSYEVWEVLAVNGTHIKLRRKTNYTGEFSEEILVLKDNYNFSFAEDFVN